MGKKGKKKGSKKRFKKITKKARKSVKKISKKITGGVDEKWKKSAQNRGNIIDRILNATKFGAGAELIEVNGSGGKCGVFVQPIQQKCTAPAESTAVTNIKQELQICAAEKASLNERIKNIERDSIPIDVVRDSLNSVFAQYSKLLGKYSVLQNNSSECQSAYDVRTQELKNISEKYLTDLSKCNTQLKTFYDEHIAENDDDAIYKEETNTLKNMIQNSKSTLIWTFLILIALIIACVLKKFRII